MTVNPYLFAAYLAIWTAIFFYLVYLHRRQQDISRRLDSLSDSLRSTDDGD